MPSSRHARRIRSAISPRLAMMIFSSMATLFDDEQRLAELNGVAVAGHDGGDAAGLVRLDLVHHLHCFDDAEGLPDLDFVTDLDERLPAGRGGGIERAHHRRGHDMLVRARAGS